jgi:CDP-glycerol glycerophosphotransferase (TagB/SpsB family)
MHEDLYNSTAMEDLNNIPQNISDDFESFETQDSVSREDRPPLPKPKNIIERIRFWVFMVNVIPFYFSKGNTMGFVSLSIIKNTKRLKSKNLEAAIPGKKFPMKLYLGRGIPFPLGFSINIVKLVIPADEVIDANIQTKVAIIDSEPNFWGGLRHGYIVYSLINLKRGAQKSGGIMALPERNSTTYFRQSEGNTLKITNRIFVLSDQKLYQRRLKWARILSAIPVGRKNVLMYEKEGRHYEESAQAVFEKLVDEGYENLRYVLDEKHENFNQIDPKYKRYILRKDSFEHYLSFFQTRKFVGTEAIQHSIGLRTPNRAVMKRLRAIRKGMSDFAFLQHGVVCMISFGLELRRGWRKSEAGGNKGKGLRRVVVSSHAEAEHFVEYADYEMSDMYITGLPKFDRSIKYDNADKIVIMLTWRRWEANKMKKNFSGTRYYEMLKDILSAIPAELHNKVIIKPHPLLASYLCGVKSDLDCYIDYESSYDEILRNTALLITDYSSISTDAFFRGTNVIFYWNQLNECLENYGEGAWLILGEQTIFGDVCHEPKELEKLVPMRYLKEQPQEYKERYKKVVEFSDRRNTERVVKLLRRDKFIH